MSMFRNWEEHQAYHFGEAQRIQGELDKLGVEFSAGGPVRTILQRRIHQEYQRAQSITKPTSKCDCWESK